MKYKLQQSPKDKREREREMYINLIYQSIYLYISFYLHSDLSIYLHISLFIIYLYLYVNISLPMYTPSLISYHLSMRQKKEKGEEMTAKRLWRRDDSKETVTAQKTVQWWTGDGGVEATLAEHEPWTGRAARWRQGPSPGPTPCKRNKHQSTMTGDDSSVVTGQSVGILIRRPWVRSTQWFDPTAGQGDMDKVFFLSLWVWVQLLCRLVCVWLPFMCTELWQLWLD